MATRRTPIPARRASTPARVVRTRQGVDLRDPRVVDIHQRLEWSYIDITDIVPYEFNARDNAKAIPQVVESIRAFGFVIPCVIDDDGVLVAGHTRVEAAKILNMTAVPCLRASHLTSDQLKQFRLIDNKVSEAASWNFDLLGAEMVALQDSGIDFTKFGWNQEEIDCLSDVVAADCLDGTEAAGAAAASSSETQERRAPVRARFVLGEMVFFIEAANYRVWADGLRNLMEFNEQGIVAEIKRRLGINE